MIYGQKSLMCYAAWNVFPINSLMPFASINPIFMEMNSWKFGHKQITIHKLTKSQFTNHKSLGFHLLENQLKYGVAWMGLNLYDYQSFQQKRLYAYKQ